MEFKPYLDQLLDHSEVVGVDLKEAVLFEQNSGQAPI